VSFPCAYAASQPIIKALDEFLNALDQPISILDAGPLLVRPLTYLKLNFALAHRIFTPLTLGSIPES